MYINPEYKEGVHAFPKDDIDPEIKKQKDWCLKFAKAIYTSFMQGRSLINYDNYEEYKRLRLYGAGKQDNEQYKNYLLGKKPKSGVRKAWMNINWDVVSVVPKFKSIVTGMFHEVNHDIVANAIDSRSGAEKEDMKWQAWFNKVHGGFVNDVNQEAGLPSEEQGYVPESLTELDLFEEMGGFKLKSEINIEKLLKYTDYDSDFDNSIKPKIIEDLFDLNIAGAETKVESKSGKVRLEYVDPLKTIVQYSRRTDFKNSEYGATVVDYTISELRRLFPKKTEKEVKKWAIHYRSYANNMSQGGDFGRYEQEIDSGGYGYDDFKIPVLRAYYRTVDTEYRLQRKNKRGEVRTYPSKYGKEKNTDKRKTTKTPVQVVYQCHWIIGTDEAFDYGVMKDGLRKDHHEAEIPIKLVKLPGRSMTSLMESDVDQLCLLTYKLQNAIIKSQPYGYTVEYSSISNINLGGDEGVMSPLDVLRIRTQTGTLFYKSTTHASGRPSGATAAKPVHELEGGIGRQLKEFLTLWDKHMNNIRELTGINRAADASNPSSDQGLGLTQMALQATQNALKPIYISFLTIKQRISVDVVTRVINIVKHNKISYESYYPVLGKSNLELMKITKEDVDRTYGIELKPMLQNETKMKVEEAAITAMQPGKNGNSAIDITDYLLIVQELDKGNIKFARVILNHKIKKNKERQEQEAERRIQLQGEQNMKLEEQKSEKKREETEFKNESEWTYKEKEMLLEDKLKEREHQREMQRTRREEILESRTDQ